MNSNTSNYGNSNVSSNTTLNNGRPVRSAAISGEQQRKNLDKSNSKLDKQLEKDMGSSSDKYNKDGSIRKEYNGY